VAATSTCWWRVLLRVLCGRAPRVARHLNADAHTFACLVARPVTQAAAHVSGALRAYSCVVLCRRCGLSRVAASKGAAPSARPNPRCASLLLPQRSEPKTHMASTADVCRRLAQACERADFAGAVQIMREHSACAAVQARTHAALGTRGLRRRSASRVRTR
jgi:hypothetical protein